MEQSNAGKDMWLEAQTANQELKQNAETQEFDGQQSCLYYITQLEVISHR